VFCWFIAELFGASVHIYNMAAASEVSQLFSDLEQCEKSGNYIKGLKIANKSKRLF
jgi:hypothetical protein